MRFVRKEITICIRARHVGWHLAIALTMVFGCAPVQVAQTPVMAPDDLVRLSVENELRGANESASFMFRVRKETLSGSQTQLYVQTRQATIAMLIAINDRPLTPEKQQAEEARLDELYRNPDELRHKQKQEKEDADRISRIVHAMPNAFIYEYDGTDTGKSGVGRPGDKLVRLKFRPKPNFSPPSRTEQVLTGMQGHLLIDASKYRMAEIDGTLYKNVSFAWGILGHLDKGGHLHVELGENGDSSWTITRMSLNFSGRILLFKSLVIRSDEVYSNFQSVPADLTLAQGVALLKK
jgi:hypothetical protein